MRILTLKCLNDSLQDVLDSIGMISDKRYRKHNIPVLKTNELLHVKTVLEYDWSPCSKDSQDTPRIIPLLELRNVVTRELKRMMAKRYAQKPVHHKILCIIVNREREVLDL